MPFDLIVSKFGSYFVFILCNPQCNSEAFLGSITFVAERQICAREDKHMAGCVRRLL
jgi:hypothetical protein